MIDRYNTKNPIIGTLYLTATHLIFVEPETNKETWVSFFFPLCNGLLRYYVVICLLLSLAVGFITGSGSCSTCYRFLFIVFLLLASLDLKTPISRNHIHIIFGKRTS